MCTNSYAAWPYSKTFRACCLTGLFLLVQLGCFRAAGSDSLAYMNAKTRLLNTVKEKPFDRSFQQSIDHFYTATCDSLIKRNTTVDGMPVMELLTRLFNLCYNKLKDRSISPLRLPALNSSFLQTVKGYKKVSVRDLYMGLDIAKSQVLQAVFHGLLLGDSIQTFTGLREMLLDPYLISSRIRSGQYAAYTDTLLYHMANGAPVILVDKLGAYDPFYTRLVLASRHKTVKAIARLTPGNYFDETLPFGMALYENRITGNEIRQLLLSPAAYYHAFTTETIRLFLDPDKETSHFLKQPLTALNKKLANHYFIKTINELHELPDPIRFESVNGLPATDLYFILLAGNNELVPGGSSALYTSSFLYVYKKFLKETEKAGLDHFFESIGYYGFDQFISNITEYALVDNLVDNLQDEKVAGLLWTYMAGLPARQLSDHEIMLHSMTLAEVLVAIRHHAVIRTTLLDSLHTLQQNGKAPGSLIYRYMFAGFTEILIDEKTYTGDSSYDVLPVSRLRKDNMIVQANFYYDDEDGSCSFNNSTAYYNTNIWDKKDLGNYIVFISKTGNPMRVYMNKPNTSPGCDSAQDEMLRDIARQGYEVRSFIHRGHSYHLPQSLRKMTPAAQFVFLGSCGGYSQVLKIFDVNPDVNIIVSRGVGSMYINDPLLEKINGELAADKDINWNKLWGFFGEQFQSKQEKDFFSSYLAPNKYIGIKFIRNVFKY